GTVVYKVFSDNQCTTLFTGAGSVNVTNGTVPDSNSVQFNAAGTYYWQASYSGDGDNKPATDGCPSETLGVAKNSPTIATTLSATSVAIGTFVHDSSALTGATSDAGGSVTYTVYKDNACTNSIASGGTKTVSNGIVPDSNAVQFNKAGTFYWQ